MQCSLMKEITKTEEAVKDCYERVVKLEGKLHNDKLSGSRKDEIKADLEEVKKLLATNKEQLSNLHKDNRKSFMFAVAVMLGFFVLYMFYILLWGSELKFHL